MLRGILADWAHTLGLTKFVSGELPPTVGSLIFYAINITLCFTLLRLNRTFTPRHYKVYVGDFISTLIVCAGSLENGNMYKNYGLPGLFFTILIFSVIYTYVLTEWSASPLTNFQNLFKKTGQTKQTLIRIALQAVAGIVAYQYSRSVWYLEIHDYHKMKYAQNRCYSGLTVTIPVGFVIEATASIMDSYQQWYKLVRFGLIDTIIKSAFASFAVTQGVHLTGMFYNPAMASCHFLGCEGTDVWQHLVVYWLGPFCGVWLAVYMNQQTHLPSFLKSKPIGSEKQKNGVKKALPKPQGGRATHSKVKTDETTGHAEQLNGIISKKKEWYIPHGARKNTSRRR